jgi:hypothetical protein
MKLVSTVAGKHQVKVELPTETSKLTFSDVESIQQSIRDGMVSGSILLFDQGVARWRIQRCSKPQQINFLGGI